MNHYLRPLLAAALSLLCLAASPAVAQAPAPASAPAVEAEQLDREFNSAMHARDYPRAIELGRRLLELAPRGGAAAYNLGCAYVLHGDRNRGLEFLRRAATEGFTNVDQISKDPDLVSLRQDTEFNALIQQVRLNKQKQAEEFQKKVEQSKPLVFVPAGVDPARPSALVVALHDFGKNAEDIADVFQPMAAELGFVLVAPRAVLPAPAGGYEWGEADGAGAIVTRAIELAKAQCKIDERRVVLAGYSQGAWMACRLAMRNPRGCRGALALAGPIAGPATEMVIPVSPIMPRFAFILGANDPITPRNREFAATLREKDIEVRFTELPGVGHELPKDLAAELRAGLAFLIGAPPAPPPPRPATAPAGGGQ